MKSLPKMKLCVSLLVLFLAFFNLASYSQEKHDGRIPIEIVEALGLSRTELIRWAKQIIPELEFSEVGRVNGMPIYEAKDKYKTIVQFVGEEKVIKQAKWTYTFTTDPEVNKKLVINVTYFAYIFEPKKMPEWIKKEMELLSKDLLVEFVGEKQRIGFNKMAQLIYSPKQKLLSIAFTTR